MTATDFDLLRKFACDHSQDAFTTLVNRHVNLVYSAALRQVRSAQLAEEIAQSVFADLARNVEKLKPDTVLTAWLYAVARRTAVDVIRKESRRQLREQVAVEMNAMNAAEAHWNEIEPLLDDALAALDETDRTAILLRYFENKNLREVGASLNLSDDAAQKRVSRAVERLREFFSKRNVTIGASGLAVLISANAVQSAPVSLAATISTGIFAGTAVSTAAVIAVTKTIAMTTFQKTLITAALAVTAGAGIFEAHQAAQLREQNQTLQQSQTTFADQLRQLQQALDDATNRLANVIAENEQLQSGSDRLELLKLRGQIGLLRNAANDPTAAAAKAWLERVNKLKQRLAANPKESIPELQLLNDNDWLTAAMNPLKSENDYRKALSSLRNAADSKVANDLSMALVQYLKANNAQFPTDLSQLAAFLDPQLDDSILSRWDIEPASNFKNSQIPHGNTLIALKESVDGEYDYQNLIGPDGDIFSTSFNHMQQDPAQAQENKNLESVISPVLKAYSDAHDGQLPGNPMDALPYATTPEQQAEMQKMIQMYQQAQQHIQSATNQIQQSQ